MGDVGMIARCQQFGFTLKTCVAMRILGARLKENLDRHLAFEPGVTSPMDFAQPAGPDRGQDFVKNEPCASSQGQGSKLIVLTAPFAAKEKSLALAPIPRRRRPVIAFP